MIETPKRRGRPPGSKNKPTPVDVVPPANIESYTLGPVGIRVVVVFKVAMSAPTVETPIDWPTGWPIPQLNDVIKVHSSAGRVQYVEYDYDRGVIRITAT